MRAATARADHSTRAANAANMLIKGYGFENEAGPFS